MNDRELARALLLPTLLFLIGLNQYPFIYGIYMSLFAGDFDRFVGFKNYVDALRDGFFWGSLKTTLLYAAGAVTLELGLGLILALLLSSRWVRGRGMWQLSLVMPLAIPPVVAGTIWNIIYHPAFGPIRPALIFLGIPAPGWLSDPRIALFSVTLIDAWQWTPFAFIVFLAGIRAISTEVEEAALVDGASYLQRVKSIILPQIKLLVIVVLFFRLVDTIKVFDPIQASTLGGPGFVTETLSIYIYRIGFKVTDFGYAAAISMYLFLLTWAVGMVLFTKIWKEAR